LGWTTGGGGRNFERVNGISGGEIWETGSEQRKCVLVKIIGV
jgi:hypothetical protein